MATKEYDKPSKYTNKIMKKAFKGPGGKKLMQSVVSYIQAPNPGLTPAGVEAQNIANNQLPGIIQQAIGPQQQYQVQKAISSQDDLARAQAQVSAAMAQAQGAYSGGTPPPTPAPMGPPSQLSLPPPPPPAALAPAPAPQAAPPMQGGPPPPGQGPSAVMMGGPPNSAISDMLMQQRAAQYAAYKAGMQ